MEKQQPVAYLKLPFQFEPEKLIAELSQILQKEWLPHFNQREYQGNWTSLALFAPGGEETNILTMQGTNLPILETSILKDCPYLKEVILQFKCPLLSVRLLRLGPGAYIKPHRDDRLGYEDGEFRLHIPIQTNPEVQFVLDGRRIEMLPGECWYTNVNYEHSVRNEGEADRVHLVIDAKRNDWSDELFFSLASKEHFLPMPITHSEEELQRMIRELEALKLPASKELIANLQAKLKKGDIG